MFQILNGLVPYIPHAWKEKDALRGQPGRRGGRDPTRTPAPKKSTVRPPWPPHAPRVLKESTIASSLRALLTDLRFLLRWCISEKDLVQSFRHLVTLLNTLFLVTCQRVRWARKVPSGNLKRGHQEQQQ